MKGFKGLRGILVVAVFVGSLLMTKPLTAEADNYTYRVRIVIGGGEKEGAYFNTNLGITIPSNATISFIGSDHGCIEISNLNYGDEIVIDPEVMVDFNSEDAKYYVKGFRISGTNTVIKETGLNVKYDETYVIAYGVKGVDDIDVDYVDIEHAGDIINERVNESVNTMTVQGDPEYTYQVIDRPVPAEEPAVENNRNINQAATEGDGTSIGDGETPRDIIEIGEEEPSKHGDKSERLERNMIVAIVIASVSMLTVCFALFIAATKRRRQEEKQ